MDLIYGSLYRGEESMGTNNVQVCIDIEVVNCIRWNKTDITENKVTIQT